jgi:hypothetical protein
MFASIWSALSKSAGHRSQRQRPLNRRPNLEVLEDRYLLSGGPGPSVANLSGPSSPQVVVLNQGGGPGSSGTSGSGGIGISGPGYPLPPVTGPVRPDPSTLSQPPATIVLMPVSGTPGGSGPTMTVVPICTGTGPIQPDPATLSQPPTTSALMPVSGTPGGSGPTMTVVPISTGTGSGGTTGG